jgi:hypothetical protein
MEASICSMGRCASSGCTRFVRERPMDFPRVGAVVSHEYACGQDTGHVHHAADERAHVQHSDRSRRFDKAHAPPGATHGKVCTHAQHPLSHTHTHPASRYTNKTSRAHTPHAIPLSLLRLQWHATRPHTTSDTLPCADIGARPLHRCRPRA